jgi:hypothetical protein
MATTDYKFEYKYSTGSGWEWEDGTKYWKYDNTSSFGVAEEAITDPQECVLGREEEETEEEESEGLSFDGMKDKIAEITNRYMESWTKNFVNGMFDDDDFIDIFDDEV